MLIVCNYLGLKNTCNYLYSTNAVERYFNCINGPNKVGKSTIIVVLILIVSREEELLLTDQMTVAS